MSAAQTAIPGVRWAAPTMVGRILDDVADHLERTPGNPAFVFHGALATAADGALRGAARTHLVRFLGAPVGVWLQTHTVEELVDACRFAAREDIL